MLILKWATFIEYWSLEFVTVKAKQHCSGLCSTRNVWVLTWLCLTQVHEKTKLYS